MILYNLLFISYCLLLIYIAFKNRNNCFSPPVLFAITMAFYTVPDMLTIFNEGILQYTSTLPFSLKSDPTAAVNKCMAVQLLFVLAYYAGYKYFMSRKSITQKNHKSFIAENSKLNILLSVSIIILCLYATFDYFQKRGGILMVLASFTNRQELAEEAGFIMAIIPSLMVFALAFGVKYCSQTRGKHIIIWIFMILSGFITLTSGGGRSAFVVYVLSLLCYYNFWIKKVNLFSVKFLPIYGALALFIIVFQLLRFQDSSDISLTNALESSDALFDSMAYMKTQLLIQNYFVDHNYWFGRIYTFLLYIFIPRSMCPTKPFIDEGSYIYNMTYNPADVLSTDYFYNSWPPFTCGVSYANMGFLGVIIGAVVLGSIHSYIYKKVLSNNNAILISIIYVFLVLKFQLTIFYIANLSYLVIQCFLIRGLYKIVCSKKKQYSLYAKNTSN